MLDVSLWVRERGNGVFFFQRLCEFRVPSLVILIPNRVSPGGAWVGSAFSSVCPIAVHFLALVGL